MGYAEENSGLGGSGILQKSINMWQQRRISEAQEESARQKDMKSEAQKQDQGGEKKRQPSESSKPLMERGLNAPESGSSALMRMPSSMAPGASYGGSTGGGYGTTHAMLMNELTSRGVKPEVAAGAIGSLMGESGRHLDPHAYGHDVNGPSGGIAQWHDVDGRGGRFSALLSFAGVTPNQAIQNGRLAIPTETQVKFLGHELDTSQKHVLDSLRGASTVSEGNAIWTKKFEVPAHADAQVAKRQGNGDHFWNYWQQNGGSNIGGATPRGPIQEAGRAQYAQASTGTATDAAPPRPAQPSASVTPQTSTNTSSTPPTAAAPTTAAATAPAPAPATTAPTPPRRPSDAELAPEFPVSPKFDPANPPQPPSRPEQGPPMPADTTKTAPATQTQPAAQQDQGWDIGKDIGGFFDSVFGTGQPIKDQYGRVWDGFSGWTDPPGGAKAQPSIAEKTNAGVTPTAAASSDSGGVGGLMDSFKSIFDDSKSESSSSSSSPLGDGFSGALNFMASIFG